MRMHRDGVAGAGKDAMDSSDKAALIEALRKVPVTKAEMAELVRLYNNPCGCACTAGTLNEPQGATIRRCGTFGRRARKAMGREPAYGMGLVGYCDPATATWRMRPQFRALMRELGWASGGPGRTLVDEIDALDDPDALDEEARLIAAQEAAIRNSERISQALKEQLLQSRLGQGQFRLALQQFEKDCRVTGIADPALLRACHMRPWRACSNAQRMDGANGLLLEPGFHLLFSKGCIGFDGAGHLLVSGRLPEHVAQQWPVRQAAAPRPFARPQLEYLAFHTARVFQP